MAGLDVVLDVGRRPGPGLVEDRRLGDGSPVAAPDRRRTAGRRTGPSPGGSCRGGPGRPASSARPAPAATCGGAAAPWPRPSPPARPARPARAPAQGPRAGGAGSCDRASAGPGRRARGPRSPGTAGRRRACPRPCGRAGSTISVHSRARSSAVGSAGRIQSRPCLLFPGVQGVLDQIVGELDRPRVTVQPVRQPGARLDRQPPQAGEPPHQPEQRLRPAADRPGSAPCRSRRCDSGSSRPR